MPSTYYKTPWCQLKITQQNGCLCRIDFVREPGDVAVTQDMILRETLAQIGRYQQASTFVFELPLDLQGTDFQRRVWSALQQIPAGQTRTYGELARTLQSSPRAVGNACRKNPLPLIVPCHRVVSAQGIGGFAGQRTGQKVDIKEQLLRHEGVEF
ncbi:Methylated-DNA--protein-cysteine methyltransferase [hydrothermal vent metagenome]|uniref:methylated-DNA--[protein]-cysteine S-methyltransferase n=1 Tax=hydrothermal vent metagenome TaxID=652676 RepID=A0A3B0X4J7_9ZZZZ